MSPTDSARDFRARLKEAVAIADPSEKFKRLAHLAGLSLGHVETIQLDRVLAGFEKKIPADYTTVRVAVLSSCTVDHLLPAIRVAGLRRRLNIECHAGRFGQYRQELLEPDAALTAFRPDVVILSLTAREPIAGVPVNATAAEADQAVSEAVTGLRGLWQCARRQFCAVVVQQTYLDVFEPLFGSYERQVPGAPARLVQRLNDRVAEAAAMDGVLLLDIAQASARDGLHAWYDVARWLHGKMEIAPQAGLRYGEMVARLICAQRGRSRKCLVLDLDNTLWGGEVGDVGQEGLVLGEGSARGEAHLALQRYVKLLKDRGVILAVCSKNDPAIAEQAFCGHPEMALRRKDVAAFVANWNDKAENLQRISEELNIGLDSLVFLDDNPVERARVREALPAVAVPELPDDPAFFVRCLSAAGYFEAVGFTDEDARRGDQYAANAEREGLREACRSVKDFLRELRMTVFFGPVTPVDLARVTQLINKTNQFNTTGRRYSADEVAQLAKDSVNLTLQFRLADRFGDNGLVGAMILRPGLASDALDIDVWVMSCRVFGRQLEDEAMNIAVETARARGITSICASLVPTDRNKVIGNLYERLGFSRVDTLESSGGSRWMLEIAQYTTRPTFIDREQN
jgi:FkbH-like protein